MCCVLPTILVSNMIYGGGTLVVSEALKTELSVARKYLAVYQHFAFMHIPLLYAPHAAGQNCV